MPVRPFPSCVCACARVVLCVCVCLYARADAYADVHTSNDSLLFVSRLNSVTTGGHVLAGKIMSNRMIDMQVSNNKLYFRYG